MISYENEAGGVSQRPRSTLGWTKLWQAVHATVCSCHLLALVLQYIGNLEIIKNKKSSENFTGSKGCNFSQTGSKFQNMFS